MMAVKITIADDGLGHWSYEFNVAGRLYDSLGQRLYSERAARRMAERHATAVVHQKTFTYDFEVGSPVPPVTYTLEVAE